MRHPDDDFHTAGDDPWWFESFWFSFFVPERKLMVYVYPWFRPGLGTCGGGVLAWDDLASEPWNIVHHDYAWHLPCKPGPDLWRDGVLHLPQQVRITPIEPMSTFRVEYSHNDLQIDVVFTAVRPAHTSSKPVGDSQLFAGRIDQAGHVTGRIHVNGEELAIDCFCIRDRSWGIRRDDNHNMHIGYFHATRSADDAFLAVVDHTQVEQESSPVVSGYLLRGGQISTLASGSCRVDRNEDGVPVSAHIEAVDQDKRQFEAVGSPMNSFAYQVFPGMFNWSALAHWRFGACEAFGELQDTWHPDRWRRFARDRLFRRRPL